MTSLSRTLIVLRTSVCIAGILAANAAISVSAADVAAAAALQSSPDDGEFEPEDMDVETDSGSSGGNEIIVRGARLRGQLDVEQAPLLELDEAAIAAEGVSSIDDLITQITNQTGSARGRGDGGRPVILVNGIRIGSFRELRSYPPEALAKVEVFPEEVAQRFGFPPDRRVINLILKDDYSSREIELEFGAPDRGGYFQNEQEFGYLKIADGARINLNLEANDTSLLTEAERDILQTESSISDLAADPDQAEARSLIADSRSLEANLSYAKAFIESATSVSANVNYTRNDTRSLFGLDTVTLVDPDGNSTFRTFGEDNPLERRTSTDTVSASGSLTKPIKAFLLTTTFDASLIENQTLIDQNFDTDDLVAQAAAGTLALDGALPSGVVRDVAIADTQTISGSTLTTLRGPLAYLPGGEVIATFDVGLDWEQIESSDTRTDQFVQLTRRDLSTGANIVIPITSRRNGFADALGSFTLTAQAGLNDLSDFGTLGDYNIGLNWSPVDSIDLSVNYIFREVAPDLAELGDPEIVTLNTAVFDFVTGETVLADVTTGGNPILPAETQRDLKIAANWELPFVKGTRLSVEYIRNRSDDVTSDFPALTAAIQAAFPDRITRDDTGTLIALDRRSVAFAETRADRLQFILSTRGSIGGNNQGGGDGGGRQAATGGNAQGQGQGQGRRGSQQGGGPGGGGPQTEEQRAQFAVFREKVCAADGAQFLANLVQSVENGEDVSDQIPGFDPQRFDRILSRARDEDGNITPERLEQFRETFCSRGPGGPGGQGAGQGEAQGGQRGGQGGAGFNPLARGQRSGWRYFATLTHTIELTNDILIASGIPVLDQLDGDSTLTFGVPENTSRLEAGLFGNGVGVRLSGQYTGSARVNGITDISLNDIATFDLRVFTNVGELVGKEEGLLKNLRVTLRADNILDAQRRVTDGTGETPINFQPLLIDPIGRFFGIDIRKLF